MKRRRFVVRLAAIGLGWLCGARWLTRRSVAQDTIARDDAFASLDVRRVLPGDQEQLLSLMKSCVDERDSFHGLCNPIEWTESWAEGVVKDRPRSVVVTLADDIVAYFDLPSSKPELVGDEKLDRHARTFWCGAAGVRLDVLGEEASVDVFQQLLGEAFSDAMDLGYEYVRAAAPWEQHPYLPQPFKDYPGLSVREFTDENGGTKYLLEWRLMDAVEALAKATGARAQG